MDRQQTKGEWVATGRMFIELNGEQIVYEVICDQCKGLAYFRRVTSVLFGADYCPYCGARMVEPTCDTCEYNTAAFNPCNACKDKSEYKPQEGE